MSALDNINQEQLDLYHRTTNKAANAILRSGQFKSNIGSTFFSDDPDGHASRHYGSAIVHVRVPADLPHSRTLNEYTDGTSDTHYAIDNRKLGPEHIVGRDA